MTGKNDSAFLKIIESCIEKENAKSIVEASFRFFNKNSWDGDQNNRNNRGRFFELLIQRILVKEGVVPFYVGAELSFVPDVRFDIILYTQEKGPLCLSLKTSLRERYKQANLEAMALKHVHRRSKTFLLTLESREAKRIEEKIKNGSILDIDGIVDCNTSAIDDLISELKEYKITKAGKVDIIKKCDIVDS